MAVRKIVSWNVNGIRALVRKEGSLSEIFTRLAADIICLQETKITESDVEQFRAVPGYESFWSFSKQKKGCCLPSRHLTLRESNQVSQAILVLPPFVKMASHSMQKQESALMNSTKKDGLSWQTILILYCTMCIFQMVDETEEWILKWNFTNVFWNTFERNQNQLSLWVMSTQLIILLTYITKTYAKLTFQQSWSDRFQPPLVTGFLDCEREWITELLNAGFTDSYRHFYPTTPNAFTWWDPKTFSRDSNKGWRLDDFFLDNVQWSITL